MGPNLTNPCELLDFATSLYADLVTGQNEDGNVAEERVRALDTYITAALKLYLGFDRATRGDLDTIGTKLWNTCTGIMRRDGVKEEFSRFCSRGASAFLFSFFIEEVD